MRGGGRNYAYSAPQACLGHLGLWWALGEPKDGKLCLCSAASLAPSPQLLQALAILFQYTTHLMMRIEPSQPNIICPLAIKIELQTDQPKVENMECSGRAGTQGAGLSIL